MWSDYKFCAARPFLAAVDGWFGAPLGGEQAYCLIDVFIEAEQVADDTAVKEGAVFVGVGEVGGLEVEVAELVEYRLRGL